MELLTFLFLVFEQTRMTQGYFYTLSAIAQVFAAIIALNTVFFIYKFRLLKNQRDKLIMQLREILMQKGEIPVKEIERMTEEEVLSFSKGITGGEKRLIDKRDKIFKTFDKNKHILDKITRWLKITIKFNVLTIIFSLAFLPWGNLIPDLIKYVILIVILFLVTISLLVTVNAILLTLESGELLFISRIFESKKSYKEKFKSVRKEKKREKMSKGKIPLVNNKYFYIPIFFSALVFILRPVYDEKIKEFVNRPQLSGKIQKVISTGEERHSWKVTIFSRITNSGNSGTSIDFRNVEVIFPECSSNSLVLPPISGKKPLKINAQETIYDTTSVVLPLRFKSENKNNLPNWEKIKLNMSQPKKPFVIVVNSSDEVDPIYNMVQMKSFYDSLDKLFGYPLLREWDEVGDSILQQKIKVGKSYVEFKGKKYLNYLSPPQVEIEYEIKRDSIYVKSKNFKEEYFLYPDPKIRDITVLPKPKIKITIGTKKNDKIYMRYTDLIFKGKKEIIQFFE